MKPVLEWLEHRSIPSVIVSSGGHENITTLLRHWALLDRFTELYCRDSPAGLKLPEKQLKLRFVIQQFGRPAAVIEDSRNILGEAHQMGYRTIGIKHELNDLRTSDCDLVLSENSVTNLTQFG